MPRMGQWRRCSYLSLELFLCVLDRSLGSRRAWPIELVEKLCLRPPWFFLRSHRRGTLCYGLNQWARLSPRSPTVEVHDLSPRLWSSILLQTAMDCLGDVVPVGTCHACWINSLTSNRFDPIELENKYFGTSFSIRSDRLAIYFPRPNLQMPSWWFIFGPNHMKLEVDS